MGSSDTAAIAVMASARDPVPPHSTKKALSWWGILAAGYNVCNSWLVFVATLTISLPYGPMNTIWGLIATTVGYTCIGLTLAELVSAWPTAGGQYHWTYILAPKWCRRFLVSRPQISRMDNKIAGHVTDHLLRRILRAIHVESSAGSHGCAWPQLAWELFLTSPSS